MRRALALAVIATTLGACLFPDLGVLSSDASIEGSTDGNTPADDVHLADSPADSSSRIKNITFENGSIVDPLLGGSSANYPFSLLGSDAGPLMGAFSVATHVAAADAANPLSSLTQDFAPPARLYVSMLVRVESEPTSAARFFKIGNAQTTLEGYIVPSSGAFVFRLKVRLTTTSTMDKTLGDSPPFPLGQTVRFGVEAFQQSSAGAMDAVVNGYAALGTADFPASFSTSAQETLLGPSDEVVLGASTTQYVDIAFDDIRIDSAQMPEP